MDVVVYCAGILRRSDFLLVPDWHQCQCTDFLSRVPAHRQRGSAPAAVLSTHIGDRDAKCVLSVSRWMDNHYSSAPDHTTLRRAEHRVAAAIAAEDDIETMMRFALLASRRRSQVAAHGSAPLRKLRAWRHRADATRFHSGKDDFSIQHTHPNISSDKPSQNDIEAREENQNAYLCNSRTGSWMVSPGNRKNAQVLKSPTWFRDKNPN
jgi:hypothetical protein